MKRVTLPKRQRHKDCDANAAKEALVDDDVPFLQESAYYQFTRAEVEEIVAVTQELQTRCLEAVDYAITHKLYNDFCIPEYFWSYTESSWSKQEISVYGRFDLYYDGTSTPKLYEYNADTPTSLVECATMQAEWMARHCPNCEQYNQLETQLCKVWARIAATLDEPVVHFTSIQKSLEDKENALYMMKVARTIGLEVQYLPIEDIAWHYQELQFKDSKDRPIKTIFKLYPWEWMVADDFGRYVLFESTRWIEPAWKMLLSNKALLPLLWKLFPQHPNLLPSFHSVGAFSNSYVKKPLLSREGANISIVDNSCTVKTDGTYGKEGFIYQAFQPLPNFNGNHPVLGSWVVDNTPAGIGIREDKGLITGISSRFTPHVIY